MNNIDKDVFNKESNMKKQVIIFNAPPDSGKDVAVEYMLRILESEGYKVKHLEFKETLFTLVKSTYGITEEVWKGLYTRQNKELPSHYLVHNGNPTSPRNALINMSENVIKPLYGEQAFGLAACNSLSEGVNLFSDGGFNAEILPIIKSVGAKNVLIVKIFRDGRDYSKDSRDYLDNDYLGVDCIGVTNNTKLSDFFRLVEDKVTDWLEGVEDDSTSEGHIELSDSPKEIFRDYKVGDEVTICFPEGTKTECDYDISTGEESECDATSLFLNNNMINTDGVKGEIEAITPKGFRVEFPEHPSWTYLPHWLKPSTPKSIPEFKVGDRVKIVIPKSLEVDTRDHRSEAYESAPYGGIAYVKSMQKCNGMFGEVDYFHPDIGYSVKVSESETPYTYLPEWLEGVNTNIPQEAPDKLNLQPFKVGDMVRVKLPKDYLIGERVTSKYTDVNDNLWVSESDVKRDGSIGYVTVVDSANMIEIEVPVWGWMYLLPDWLEKVED